MTVLWRIAIVAVVAAGVQTGQVREAREAREASSCQSNIVSATVVATFCGHHDGDHEMLDLMILWRGSPGWFQRRELGSTGGGGSRMGGSSVMGGATKGQVSAFQTYGVTEIAYRADFDAPAVTIGDDLIPLEQVNIVLMDQVDQPGARRMAGTRQIPAALPLGEDWNLNAIRRGPTAA